MNTSSSLFPPLLLLNTSLPKFFICSYKNRISIIIFLMLTLSLLFGHLQ